MHTSIVLAVMLGSGSPVVSAVYHVPPVYTGSIGTTYAVTSAPVYRVVSYAPAVSYYATPTYTVPAYAAPAYPTYSPPAYSPPSYSYAPAYYVPYHAAPAYSAPAYAAPAPAYYAPAAPSRASRNC